MFAMVIGIYVAVFNLSDSWGKLVVTTDRRGRSCGTNQNAFAGLFTRVIGPKLRLAAMTSDMQKAVLSFAAVVFGLAACTHHHQAKVTTAALPPPPGTIARFSRGTELHAVRTHRSATSHRPRRHHERNAMTA